MGNHIRVEIQQYTNEFLWFRAGIEYTACIGRLEKNAYNTTIIGIDLPLPKYHVSDFSLYRDRPDGYRIASMFSGVSAQGSMPYDCSCGHDRSFHADRMISYKCRGVFYHGEGGCLQCHCQLFTHNPVTQMILPPIQTAVVNVEYPICTKCGMIHDTDKECILTQH